jgi:hypothetical protein
MAEVDRRLHWAGEVRRNLLNATGTYAPPLGSAAPQKQKQRISAEDWLRGK